MDVSWGTVSRRCTDDGRCGRLRWRVLGGAVAVVFLGVAAAAAQAPLQWRFQTGETIRYTLIHESTNKGREVAGTITVFAADIALTADAVDRKGVASITQRIERFRMRLITGDGKSAEFDTAANESPEGLMKFLAAGLHTILRKPITYRMTPRGEISDVKLPAELAKMPSSPAFAGSQAQELLSAEGIQQMTGVAMLPERPVMQGARWTHAITTSNAILGRQKVETVYDYRGPAGEGDRRLEEIATTSTTTPAPSPKQTIQVRIKSQQTNGTVLFDATAGRVVRSETKSQMSLNVSFSKSLVSQQMQSVRTVRLRGPSDEPPVAER